MTINVIVLIGICFTLLFYNLYGRPSLRDDLIFTVLTSGYIPLRWWIYKINTSIAKKRI